MPVYEYTHKDNAEQNAAVAACPLGVEFEQVQPMSEDALAVCPRCGQPVQRLISRTFFSAPQSNTQLRDMGFTKLVKRDTGVYENVTRRGSDSRYMESGKPDTIPDLKKTISD